MKNFLYANQDKKYQAFNQKLIPNISPERILGVRIPILRKKAKEMLKENSYQNFLESLPHHYFEENQIHALLLNEQKNLLLTIDYLAEFLPYVDNWATSDILSIKVYGDYKEEVLPLITTRYLRSSHIYTKRFGILLLLTNYLGNNFKSEYLNLVAETKGEDYYLKMAKAWYFAEALGKQYDTTMMYLSQGVLDVWTHNKAIQKARESRKIGDREKAFLNTLKRKN